MREDPELFGVVSLLFLVGSLNEKDSHTEHNEKTNRLQRPELSGVVSLLFLMRNLKDKGQHAMYNSST